MVWPMCASTGRNGGRSPSSAMVSDVAAAPPFPEAAEPPPPQPDSASDALRIMAAPAALGPNFIVGSLNEGSGAVGWNLWRGPHWLVAPSVRRVAKVGNRLSEMLQFGRSFAVSPRL